MFVLFIYHFWTCNKRIQYREIGPLKFPLKTTRSVKNYKRLKNDSNHKNPGVFSNSWPKGTQKQLVQVWGVNLHFGSIWSGNPSLITPSSWFKLLPVVFVFLLVYYLRKHLSFWKSEWFRGVSNFLHFESFLMGISMGQFPDIEFAYYAFKSGKLIKQTPTPPFWGDVGVKKWSRFFDSGTRKPIFGHLKMGTFAKSAHFQVPKNGTSSARIQNLRPLFHANIPPKWWSRCLFYSFTTFGRVIGKFWILNILSSF